MRPVGVRQMSTPGSGWVKGPAGRLLETMVVSAQLRKTAGTCRAAVLPGDRVVQVAAHRGPAAAGSRAAGGACVGGTAAGTASGLACPHRGRTGQQCTPAS